VDAEYFLVEQVKFNLIVFHPYRQAEKLIKDAEMEAMLTSTKVMLTSTKVLTLLARSLSMLTLC